MFPTGAVRPQNSERFYVSRMADNLSDVSGKSLDSSAKTGLHANERRNCQFWTFEQLFLGNKTASQNYLIKKDFIYTILKSFDPFITLESTSIFKMSLSFCSRGEDKQKYCPSMYAVWSRKMCQEVKCGNESMTAEIGIVGKHKLDWRFIYSLTLWTCNILFTMPFSCISGRIERFR